MRIKYPFTRPDVDDILKNLPYIDSALARYAMMDRADKVKAGGQTTPEEWVEVWIGRLDRDVYVDFSPDADKKEHKDKLDKTAVYIPIENRRGPNESANDFLHYFTPDTFLMVQNYMTTKIDDDQTYATGSLITGVYKVLTDMGCSVTRDGAKYEINGKMFCRFNNAEVIYPWASEEMYFILRYDEAKFRAALPGDLHAKLHRTVCGADLATQKASGLTGIKNEYPKLDEREFFERLVDHILMGK